MLDLDYPSEGAYIRLSVCLMKWVAHLWLIPLLKWLLGGKAPISHKTTLVTMGCPTFTPQNCSFTFDDFYPIWYTHSSTDPLTNPNGIQIQWAVLPQFTHRTDRQQTDRWAVGDKPVPKPRLHCIDCIVTRLINWTELIEWLMNWLTDWLTGWLTDLSICLSVCLSVCVYLSILSI